MRKKYDLNNKVKIYLEMTTIQHMKSKSHTESKVSGKKFL